MRIPSLDRCALVALCALLFGCTDWHPVPVSPREYFEGPVAEQVRVRLASGERRTLNQPYVQGDSIFAFAQGSRARQGRGLPQLALADVIMMEYRRNDGKRSGALVGGALLVAFVAYFSSGF
jgi:hypothetical protein